MKIIATFASRQSDPDVVELVTAWDEYSQDENWDGWKEDKRKSLASWGDDLGSHVDVEIEVPMQVVYDYFSGITVNATSVEVQS